MPSAAVECSLDGEETVVLCDDHTQGTADTENNSLTTEESNGDFHPKGAGLTDIVECDDDDDDDSHLDLSWRLDPRKSLSDWTIEVHALVPRKNIIIATPASVAATDNNVTDARSLVRKDVYHVHKSVLGVGPKRSGFFAQVFAQHLQEKTQQRERQNQQNSNDMLFLKELLEESIDLVKNRRFPAVKCGTRGYKGKTSSPVTVLELEAPAAEAFPALLDFVYSSRVLPPSSPARSSASVSSQQFPAVTELLDINTHAATGLHHLAVRLQIKALGRLATEFFQSDMNIDNLMVYYTHARIFDDPEVLQHASQVLAASILDMEEKLVIYFLSALDAEFFLLVLHRLTQQETTTTNAADGDDTLSIRLSLLVAIYCNLHRDELVSALTMFERLTDEQLIPVLDVKAAQVLLDIEQELKDDSTLTSLKRRCIEIVSYNWNTALLSSTEPQTLYLPPLNGEALQHFTLLALTRAKQQLDGSINSGESSESVPKFSTVPNKLVIPAPFADAVVTPPASPRSAASGSSPTQHDADDELLGQIIVSTSSVPIMPPPE